MSAIAIRTNPSADAPHSGCDTGSGCMSAARAVARVRAIENGRGLQYIINEAAGILDNPMLILNAEGKLLACTENVVTDDWVWNDTLNNSALTEQVYMLFREEGLSDEFSGIKTVMLFVNDNIKYDRLFGKSFSRDGIHSLNLMMPAVNRPFGALDPLMFEAVCGLCTSEVRMMPDITEYGRQYQQSLVIALLSKQKLDRNMSAVHAGSLYLGFKLNLFVAVLGVHGGINNSRLVELREQLRRLEPGFKYAIYRGRIVILMSTSEPELDTKRDLPRLRRFIEQRGIRAGVSGGFENMYNLRRYYADALRALRASG